MAVEMVASVKEKVINKSIKIIKKRLKVIDEMFSTKTLERIEEIQQEVSVILERYKSDDKTRREKLRPLEIEQEKLFKLDEKNIISSKIIEDEARLQRELCDLKSELFYIHMKSR